mmetsp:Transcript_17165/g.29040  ORF Transcript_17165/g.29040 Transcript_17165/m.29040 type:complete len:530 (+) Transcript_17165:163-1752(+)
MGISIDVGEASIPPPGLLASVSLSSTEASDDDIEGGGNDSSCEECFSPEDGQKITSKFITTGTGDAEFLRRQSQMGKLSLRRKSDLRLPVRNQSSSSASADDDNDFMKRLTAINSAEPEEKSARQRSIDRLEQGLPVSRSNSPTTTSNKDKFLQHLRSSMNSRRASDRKSPTPQGAPMATAVDGSPPKTIQFYPIEDIEACCDKPTQSATPEFNLTTYVSIKQLLIIPIMLIVGLVIIQNNKVTSLQSELTLSVASRDHLQKTYGTLITELHKYKDTHEKMKQVNNDLSSHTKNLREEYLVTQSELDKLRKTEKTKTWSEVRLSKLIQGIQDWSRRRVIEKYGKGPYRVELQLLLPTSKHPQFIKLELASLDLMPHAVSTFLEQVELKLWDGQTFDVHAGHVLLARPDPTTTNNDDSSDAAKGEVPTVMFAEYNENYPHEKYTVGFPGRPNAGQDFYINLQSNVAHHSPRFDRDTSTGEEQFIEGEPCFGKIIDAHSRLVVDEMDKLGVGKEGILEKKVVIVSARLIGR